MSPIEQLLMSPTWKHRKQEGNISPFKQKNYDLLGKKFKNSKSKNKRKNK
mgnify:CR=1 FL=1